MGAVVIAGGVGSRTRAPWIQRRWHTDDLDTTRHRGGKDARRIHQGIDAEVLQNKNEAPANGTGSIVGPEQSGGEGNHENTRRGIGDSIPKIAFDRLSVWLRFYSKTTQNKTWAETTVATRSKKTNNRAKKKLIQQ